MPCKIAPLLEAFGQAQDRIAACKPSFYRSQASGENEQQQPDNGIRPSLRSVRTG